MHHLKCLPIVVSLLGGWLFGGERFAADATAGQIIGLCYRDGSRDVLLEEMLNTEGVPYARLRDLDRLAQSRVKGLVLGEGFDGAAGRIKQFVEAGGVLVALKPSGGLADALGLRQAGAQKYGYLAIGKDLSSLVSYEGRLQLFGQSHCYKGGEVLARLGPGGNSGGIVRVKLGRGTAIAVAFDLPATLLAFQQPEADAGAASDASNVEYELGDVPQADLVRRLLVGLLLEAIDAPVVRKWYFPSQHTAMLVPLGDQDGADMAQMKVVLDLIKELQAPYTLYLTPTRQPMTKEQLNTLAQAGMEFAFHPDFVGRGRKFTEAEFNSQLKKAVDDAGGRLAGQRPHCCRWESFRELPAWSEKAGLQYEAILGLKAWDSQPVKLGYWVGTGLPYRWVDPADGRRMDFLEIPVAGIDNFDFWKSNHANLGFRPGGRKLRLSGLNLSQHEAFLRSKQFIDRVIEKYPAVYGYCWHPVYLAARALKLKIDGPTDVHFRKCIDYARGRGVGLIGSNALNGFWRAREKVSVDDFVWDDGAATLQCKVRSDAPVRDLTLCAPCRYRGRRAQVFVNGRSLAYAQTELFGKRYAMWTVDAGPEAIAVAIRYDDAPPAAAVSPGATAAPSPGGSETYRWELVTRKASFAPRDGAGALVFRDRMWLLGGWNPSDKSHFPRVCNNEVWSSFDGRDWTLVKPNTHLNASFDAKSDWEGRHTAGYVVLGDKMWIVGGDPLQGQYDLPLRQGRYQSDVWNSADGKAWTRVADKAPWAPRVLHHTMAFKGKIWVMGGQTLPQFAPMEERFYRDIWTSADGVKWEQVEAQEPYWSARGMIGGNVVLKGRMWILGGGIYDTPKRPQREMFNDVWSSDDGVHWQRHLAKAPWEPRQYHEVAVFDNRMWVLEGWSGANRNDVWYSSDGVSWRALSDTPWKPRHAASVFVYKNALWMVAGNNMESDVWKLVRTSK
jgi:hypothetical protein